jgi:membrane protease YdiL (CAAX protease family)
MSPQHYSWAVFALLFLAGLFAVLLPVTLDPTRRSPSLAWLLHLLLDAVVVATMVRPGLLLAGNIGHGVPLLERRLAGQRVWQPLRAMLQEAVGAGTSLGIIVLLLYVFVVHVPISSMAAIARVALWKRVLLAYAAAMEEEVLFRLVLLSLLAWLLGKHWHRPDGLPSGGAGWLANLIAALVFALAHAPRTSWPALAFTPRVMTAGMAGVLFGYLYWKHGLEAAIIAHFSADLILLALGPAFLRTYTARFSTP